ncbi:right-handed parallel beta-helix repeat-containing protein [Pseudobacteroides cellulosolvens]|uniref:Probable pectate lyase C n=1 Tax=Pseudobacteroides cellulosolvens ATCC 35603 = DSM 2933 TaxID=398512 RepID=A0A0L6JQB5_9FIRM|nr:right-handed parallel beta-helix repeat-containing protein [Pseudobacteroides cellulosolvens]KNY27880.1 parallel beta-helix repeat containing protein [Pseudobacteroides cellulosolvens ATCC 35603 = DSM 2933]
MKKAIVLSFLLITIFSSLTLNCIQIFSKSVLASTNPVSGAADNSYGHTVSGYIRPAFNFSDTQAAAVLSGFRVELEGTGLSSITNEKGYFEIKRVPSNETFVYRISKSGYLERKISNVTATENIEMFQQSSPLDMWAGDVPVKGIQDNSINMIDVVEIAKFFNKTSSDSGFLAIVDFNKDNAVNIADVIVLAKSFNMTSEDYPDYKKFYFVSPKGSDSNNGSINSPFKTLQKAASVLNAGDTCYIREGVYHEVLKPIKSGTEKLPVTFKAVQGENVVLNSCDIVSDWSLYSENVFVANVDQPVTQVFIDGVNTNEARFPNSGNDLFSPETFEITSMNEKEVLSDELSQPKDTFNGGTIWAMVGDRWISQVGKIASSEEGKLLIEGNTWVDNVGKGVGFITGVKAALDKEGEWYYDNGKIYLQLQNSDHPSNHKIEVKTRKWTIDLSSKEYINIKDLNTFGGAANLNQSNHCMLDNLSMEYLSHFTYIASGSSWLRHDWTNINYDGVGVGIFGSYNTVSNCKINWSAGDGITLYGSDNRVENCTVSNCNYSGTDCNPITVHGKGHVITKNTIYNGGRGLVSLNAAKKVLVTYNHCYNAGLMNWDIGGIYAWGAEGEGTEIAYNWIHDIYSDGVYKIGNGVYMDNYCKDFYIHHNVIWNCSYNAFNYSRPSNNIYFYNNTAFNSGDISYSYIPAGTEDTSSGNRMYNNLVGFNIGDFPALEKKNNLKADIMPLCDIENYDFQLTDNVTQAIDSGEVIRGINDNYLGEGPDIGAYEKGGEFWKAGAR